MSDESGMEGYESGLDWFGIVHFFQINIENLNFFGIIQKYCDLYFEFIKKRALVCVVNKLSYSN